MLEIDPSWLAFPASNDGRPPSVSMSLAQQERQTIVEALSHCGGKIYGPNGAAELLGLKPTTLYGKMRKHKIRKQTGRRGLNRVEIQAGSGTPLTLPARRALGCFALDCRLTHQLVKSLGGSP